MEKNIRNLDTLEREMYRLRLESKKKEDQLEENFDHLRENFASLFMNSICTKKKNKEEENHSIFEPVFKNAAVNAVVTRLSGHIAGKAIEGINGLIDKAISRKK
jgi:hypothetical protein